MGCGGNRGVKMNDENLVKNTITWDFKELDVLSKKKALPDTSVYQNTIHWKIIRTNYHAELCEEIWTTLISSSEKITLNGYKWNKAQISVEANVEATAQVLHSMADIVAQIINKVILEGKNEDDITLGKVFIELNKYANTKEITTAIKKLNNSPEFEYMNAFVNTIKHRRLLDTTYYLLREGHIPNMTKGICFQEFEYKGKKYEKQFADYIIVNSKNEIIDLILGIGISINDYLR
jgi:hypothetical protein